MLFLVSCNNAVLAVFFKIAKSLLGLIQIIGPLLSIASIAYLLIKMMQNPEDKKLPKRIFNSCLALGILFFVPLLVTLILNLVDDSTDFPGGLHSASLCQGAGLSEACKQADVCRIPPINGKTYRKGLVVGCLFDSFSVTRTLSNALHSP